MRPGPARRPVGRLLMIAKRSSVRRKRRCFSSVPVLEAAFLAASLISTFWVLLTFSGSAFVPSPSFLPSSSLLRPRRFLERKADNPDLGLFGELMISFLREDLPFTIFVPSASSFQNMFQTMNRQATNVSDSHPEVGWNESHTGADLKPTDSTFAVVSRLFGFCAIPRRILSSMVPKLGEVALQSVSGYRIHVSRQTGGALLANNFVSNRVDMTRGFVVIHVIDGIIMDADFEQSLMPYSDTLNKD